MAEQDHEKKAIERTIVDARDGIGDRIDELDRHLRANLNPKTLVRDYAPQLIAGGAVVGILIGFGVPRIIRRLIAWGVPIALIAAAVKKARENEDLIGLS